MPASPAPAAVNGRPGAAAGASVRSPCTVRPSASSAGPVPLASRAPLSRRSPPISARASRTAPSCRSPCARKPGSSSALPPIRTRSAASAGPVLLTRAVSWSTRSRRIVLPVRHSAPGVAAGTAPGIAPGSGPAASLGCPGPALATLFTRAPCRARSPASAAPRSSTVPVLAAPVAWNSVPDAGLRASLVSPLTRIPSATRAGPVALVSQAPRSSRLPPILAPASRTVPDRPARPAARSPSSKTPADAPSPTFRAAPARAAPELLLMLVPRIFSSCRMCAPSSWTAPSWLFPSIRQPVTLKVPIRARLAAIPGSTQPSRCNHGSTASRTAGGWSNRHPVNRSPVVDLIPSRSSGPRRYAPRIWMPRGSLCGPLTRRSRTRLASSAWWPPKPRTSSSAGTVRARE